MSVKDSVNYLLFNNPLSSTLISGIGSAAKSMGIHPKSTHSMPTAPTIAPVTIIAEKLPLWRLCGSGRYFIRIAGISGAAAVLIGAYGAHRSYEKFPTEKHNEMKRIFDTSSRLHFFHTLALLGVPLSRFPGLTGTLFVTGMALFCGSCYYRAITGKATVARFAPMGGICLALAWLTFAL